MVLNPIHTTNNHFFLSFRKMGSLGENKAPKFVRKPQLRQEDDGNRLIFECELSGHPQPEVSWFRQDEKIVEDGRTVFKTTETQVGTFMVVLELDDVIESDAGLYKIRAKNTHGDVAASINLNFSRKSCRLTFLFWACLNPFHDFTYFLLQDHFNFQGFEK